MAITQIYIKNNVTVFLVFGYLTSCVLDDSLWLDKIRMSLPGLKGLLGNKDQMSPHFPRTLEAPPQNLEKMASCLKSS